MSESLEDLRRITRVAIDEATKQFRGKEYAVIVLVREIGGTNLNVGSNVVGGRENMIRLLQEGATKLRGE